MSARRDAPKVAPVIERLVKALVVTAKAVSLYPPASNIPRDTAQEAAVILGQALEERPEIRLVVTKQGLLHGDTPVFPDESAYSAFALDLYNRKLADVRFHAGTTARDLVSFLGMLTYSPEEIEAAGGFEARLWDLGVSTITVSEARISVMDVAATEEDMSGRLALTRAQLDDALAGAYAGRSRDQVTIARFLGDTPAVAGYITDTYRREDGQPDIMSAGERFAELAEIAYEAGGEGGRAELLQALGDAFRELDPDIQRHLLVEQLLPEARTNEALASVVRQMDIDEVCRAIVADIESDPATREGLARAIRNLALISMSNREDVVSAAGAAMRGAGLDEEFVSEVIEMASPSRVLVRQTTGAPAGAERPAEAIFKLIDMAPGGTQQVADADPGIESLRSEARRGITDGDVIMTLVSLVAMDPSDHHFASTMSMLEDSLDTLIERGDIDVAADAADALMDAAENPELDPEQQSRLRNAIGRFTKPGDIRVVAHALRLYAPDTEEHKAARRLLDALGPAAVAPLLEQLADEPDMTVRKSLVDVLASSAARHINELGEFISDPRWYVVRNVVQILGSTRSSAVLPYMERTIRHPEPRVRREAVRALSTINDRMAHELLAAALNDEDAQNVQLAARYLGAADVRVAIPVLEQVARGEGRGSRATGPRVEAIEALGRMRAVEALPTLEALAGKRAIIKAAKVRELRSAAESSIARIRAEGGQR